MYLNLFAIALGSALGGCLRWYVGLKFNALFPAIPLGTVIVNLTGAFIIGFAMSYFASASLSPQYRLFVMTGFCGGLTTFSTFSAEIVTLLQSDKLALALLAISIHVLGSLLFTAAGMASQHWLSAA